MDSFETDYMIIGAGASGLAFADTLLDETDAQITLVDRRDQAGGHWNDAYPFVRLHQPSSFYGVSSLKLGRERIEKSGLNMGYEELASGPEVANYFHTVNPTTLFVQQSRLQCKTKVDGNAGAGCAPFILTPVSSLEANAQLCTLSG